VTVAKTQNNSTFLAAVIGSNANKFKSFSVRSNNLLNSLST